MSIGTQLREIRRIANWNALLGLSTTLALFIVLFGLEMGAALLIVLLIHELGHAVALWRSGIGVESVKFMFLIAATTPKRPYDNERQNVLVALSGPVTGVLIGGFGLVVRQLTGWPMARALAFIGLALNLFNLLPVLTLDGGHVWRAVAEAFWPKRGQHVALGVSCAVALAFAWQGQWLIAIFLGTFALLNQWVHLRTHRPSVDRDRLIEAVFGPTRETPRELALRLRARFAELCPKDADDFRACCAEQEAYRLRQHIFRQALDASRDEATTELLDRLRTQPRPDVEDLIAHFSPPFGEPLTRRQALWSLGAWVALALLLFWPIVRHWSILFAF